MSVLSPTSREPLFPLVIQQLRRSQPSLLSSEELAFYLSSANGDDDNSNRCDESNLEESYSNESSNEQQVSLFWFEAHALSCLKHGCLESTVVQTYNDVLSPSWKNNNENDNSSPNESKDSHLKLVKRIIGSKELCAYIAQDGKTLDDPSVSHDRSSPVSNEKNNFRTVRCLGERCSQNNNKQKIAHRLTLSEEKKHTFTSQIPPSLNSSLINANQIRTMAHISGMQLFCTSSPLGISNSKNNDNSRPQLGPIKEEAQSQGWFRYSATVAQKVTRGVTSALDYMLSLYEGDDSLNLIDKQYSSQIITSHGESISEAHLDDARMREASPNGVLVDENEDDARWARKGNPIDNASKSNIPFEDQIILGMSDSVISIALVVDTCHQLLLFSKIGLNQKSLAEERTDDFFVLHNNRGEADRIMLSRNGWDKWSFGSFCRKVGDFFAASSEPIEQATATAPGEIQQAIGRVLSNISDGGLALLAETLIISRYALVEDDIITIFPAGVPHNFESPKLDHALFNIMNTIHSVQSRITFLENDEKRAEKNALDARRRGQTQVALMHLRRRKAIREELERCTITLTNLEAGQLRLERAKADAQVVQSFSLLKSALQGVRKSNGFQKEELDELMDDIRDEMEMIQDATTQIMDESSRFVVDHDELEKELDKLHLDLETESFEAATSNDVIDNTCDFPPEKPQKNDLVQLNTDPKANAPPDPEITASPKILCPSQEAISL